MPIRFVWRAAPASRSGPEPEGSPCRFGAQRQKRYRERHHDDLAHITLDVRVAVRDRLGLTLLVEELAGRAELAVEATLSDAALKAYRDAGYEDEAR
jgi:hypothetical protein